MCRQQRRSSAFAAGDVTEHGGTGVSALGRVRGGATGVVAPGRVRGLGHGRVATSTKGATPTPTTAKVKIKGKMLG